MKTASDLYNALVAFHRPDDAEKVDIKTLRFVLYARKSTTSDERQERSITDQIADCMDAAKRLEIPFENIKVVREEESAKEPDIRRHFKQMIEDVKTGRYDAILTWHPDRLARNMADAGKVIDLLDKKIIKNLSFATFSFEDTPMGKMLLGISFVLSKQYSDHLSEVVQRGQRRSLEEGKSIHVAKHGYYKDVNGFLRPDGEQWVLVKQAFQLRIEKRTQEEVAEFLNRNRYSRAPTDGMPRRPYKATVNKVSVMLRDPVYAGVHMHGNSIVNLSELYDFEPVVSVDDFLSINQLSDIGAAFKMVKPMKKRGAVKADFLRGMVLCSFCSRPMAATETGKVNKSKATTKIFYFRCETKGCERKKKSLRGHVVMRFVLDFLSDHLFVTESNYKQFCQTIQAESTNRREEIEKRLMSLRRARTENDKTRDRLKNVLLQNESGVSEYFKGDMEKVSKEAAVISKEIAENEALLQKAKDAPMTYEVFLELYTNVAKRLAESDDMAWRDQVIRMFFLNLTADEQKIANVSLCQPFSDFFLQGDFLNGRAGGT